MKTNTGFEAWRKDYRYWQADKSSPRVIKRSSGLEDVSKDYPFVRNDRAPFVPARRALPMLNLALISSAGAYIDGTEPFAADSTGGDATFREIPIEIEAEDLRFTARGYDPQAVLEDLNSQIPLQRLFEFEGNGIIGQFNPVFWSFCGFIPDANLVVNELAPRLVERVTRYEAQAALLIPASRLCHQSMSLAAHALEGAGIPTMLLAVDREVVESVHPPRAGLYDGKFGSVAGLPKWPEHQRRVLDEALRLIETADQVGIRRLVVN
ncbi:MAG TPA: glycine/sarcosine/betaine reductase selenoprotein B family protein, partial [Pyrinomonadaceae bacterium]|nr:glycine/sarcosine/betaine reductase selenoprotein B family protein [Pyrinomonadaceae bacterium]